MPRRTAAEAAQTRRDILDSARTLFATKGFNGVSVPDIAKAVGVTHGALYHHFSSKEVLFKAVFDELEHSLNQTVVEAAIAAPSTWDGFLAGTRALLSAMREPDYQQIALADAPAVFGWNEWHDVDTGIGMQTLLGGLQLLKADGYLRAVHELRPFAVLLFGGMTEAGMQLAKDDPAFTTDQFVDTLCDTVLALSPGKRTDG